MRYAGVNILLAGVPWAAGPFWTLRPELLAALLGLASLGGIVVVLWAAWSCCRKQNTLVPLMAGLLGLGAVAANLGFGFLVLAGNVGEITLVNRDEAVVDVPERLRLVSFNVQHGYPSFHRQEERFRDLSAALATLEPDILLLQEAWDTPEHGNLADRLSRFLGLHHVYVRANGSRRLIGFVEGLAILSRYPVREARSRSLSPRRTWWEHRIALAASIDLGNQTLTIVNTHLTGYDKERNEDQARDLAAHLPREEFVLVAGDLNTESDSQAVRRILDAGFVDVVPGGIDHVFLPRNLEARGWKIEGASWTLRPNDLVGLIGRKAEISDHPGIVVDLLRRTDRRRK